MNSLKSTWIARATSTMPPIPCYDSARSVYHAGNRLRKGKQPIWKRAYRRACYRNMKNINQAARVIKTGEPRLHTSTFDRLRPFATGRYRPIAVIQERQKTTRVGPRPFGRCPHFDFHLEPLPTRSNRSCINSSNARTRAVTEWRWLYAPSNCSGAGRRSSDTSRNRPAARSSWHG